MYHYPGFLQRVKSNPNPILNCAAKYLEDGRELMLATALSAGVWLRMEQEVFIVDWTLVQFVVPAPA